MFENSQKTATVNQIPANEEQNIKCLYTNACSIMGKMDDLRNRVVGYDIVGITESWGSNEVTDTQIPYTRNSNVSSRQTYQVRWSYTICFRVY